MLEPLFIPASFFFLRSPRLSVEDSEPLLQHSFGIDAIFALYDSDSLLREAIAIASPSLHEALQKKPQKKTEELALSLLNYALRMATRATPFGLFSFVAMGSWSSKTDISLDLQVVEKRARPDMAWIFALVQKLYSDENSDFPIHTNSLSMLNGGRYFLSYFRDADSRGKASSETFSIRATPLVKSILTIAGKPTTISALCDELLKQTPSLNRKKIEQVIRELLSRQFLTPSLLPSLLSYSPFEDLLSNLPKSIELEDVVEKLDIYNRVTPGKGIGELQQLQQAVDKIASTKIPLQVDSVYEGVPLDLSPCVGEEVAKGMALLWKISKQHSFRSPLTDYHAKFLDKYGSRRTVPLLELLSEDKGLGPLEKISNTGPEQKCAFLQEWEKWLFGQWQECVVEKKDEIFLTDEIVDRLFTLAQETPSPLTEAPLSMDIFCRVIANSQEDVDRGDFSVLFLQPTWQGGSSLGRFVDLLDEKSQRQIHRFLECEEKLGMDELFIELSCWPFSAHLGNVSAHPCFRKNRLDVDKPKEGKANFSLQDIYVGAFQDRLYLTLKEGGKEVVACMGSLLNSANFPSPLRFMREVSLARHQLLYPFNRGDFSKQACWFPRVRFQRTILAPAQWTANPSQFRLESNEKTAEEFTLWADRWSLPDRCFLVRSDQRLLINRRHPAHLKEIAAKLKKLESLQFVEFIDSPWVKSERGHHLCEFIVPLLKNPAYSAKSTLKVPPSLPIPTEIRWKLPGSEWIFIKFYLGEAETDRFITQHLSPFIEVLDQKILSSFFLRYRDPQHHLRLRLRLSTLQSLSPVLTLLEEKSLEWIDTGLIKDMALASYEREIERYGGVDLINYAEAVFCADSLAAFHLLRVLESKTCSLEKPLLHALSAINFLRNFGLDQTQILTILKVDKGNVLKGFREQKKQLIALAQDLAPIFAEATALSKSAQELFHAQAQIIQPNAFLNIYDSMLHMHHNRLGCDHFNEKQARAYAYNTLLQLEAKRSCQCKQSFC